MDHPGLQVSFPTATLVFFSFFFFALPPPGDMDNSRKPYPQDMDDPSFNGRFPGKSRDANLRKPTDDGVTGLVFRCWSLYFFLLFVNHVSNQYSNIHPPLLIRPFCVSSTVSVATFFFFFFTEAPVIWVVDRHHLVRAWAESNW